MAQRLNIIDYMNEMSNHNDAHQSPRHLNISHTLDLTLHLTRTETTTNIRRTQYEQVLKQVL